MDAVTPKERLTRAVNHFDFQALGLIFSFVFIFAAADQIRLSGQDYRQPLILVSALRNEGVLALLAIFFICLIANYVKRSPGYGLFTWRYLQSQIFGIQFFILLAAAVITWTFAFYELNLYYNQPHLFDRLLLILLAALVAFSPLFVLPFVAYALVMLGQFEFPASLLYSLTDKRLVIDILVLFAAFLPLLPWLKKQTARVFTFVLLVMVASFYVFPAIKKLTIGDSPWDWILGNDLGLLFVSSYQNGWVSFLSVEQVVSIGNVISAWAIPLQIAAFTTEVAPILMIANRKLAMWILATCASLHLMIFFSSGIFFWKWMLMDLALVLLLFINRHNESFKAIFSPKRLLLFIPAVLAASFYFSPASLGWFDSPVNNFFTFYAKTEDGHTYRLPAAFFKPYDLPFTQNRFYFLNENPTFSGTYGVQLSEPAWEASMAINAPEQAGSVIDEFGRVSFDSSRRDDFLNFLTLWVQNYNAMPRAAVLPAFLTPLPHIITFPSKSTLPSGARISELEVRYVVTIFLDDQIYVLEDQVIALVAP